MANNPVLSKLEGPPAGSAPTQTPPPSPQDLQRMYNQPAAPTPNYPGAGGPPPSPPGPANRRLRSRPSSAAAT